MVKARETGETEKKAGMFRRFRSKVFKGKKPHEDAKPKEQAPEPAPQRAKYTRADLLGTLGDQQDQGWDGEGMAKLLRIDDHEDGIFGNESGRSSYFCNSKEDPVLSLEASPNPRDWPKRFASWSVSLHESNVSSFCTFVDMEREYDGVEIAIIVRAEIGGLYAGHGWGELERMVSRAEAAWYAALRDEKAKPFDVVLVDCGNLSFITLKA